MLHKVEIKASTNTVSQTELGSEKPPAWLEMVSEISRIRYPAISLYCVCE